MVTKPIGIKVIFVFSCFSKTHFASEWINMDKLIENLNECVLFQVQKYTCISPCLCLISPVILSSMSSSVEFCPIRDSWLLRVVKVSLYTVWKHFYNLVHVYTHHYFRGRRGRAQVELGRNFHVMCERGYS